MANVYLALKRSVGIVLLFLCQAAFAQPVVNFFHPAAGPAGTIVRISGTGFNTNADSNFVYFGAAKATVLQYINDSLIVIVPKGATYAPITVTSNRLTGYSRLPFNVTYPNGDPVIDSTSFAPVANLTGTNNPRAVTLADLNSDGKLDLFVTSQVDSSAAIYTNTSVNGSVSYSAAQNISLGAGPFGAAIGDLNGDGKLDVAVANFNSGGAGTVSVLRNTTVAGNSISFAKSSYATGNGTLSVAIVDVDKDGKPDLLVTSGNSGYISVFRNTSTTTSAITFAPAVTISDYFHSDNITVADFDGDGKVDFATANFAAGISIWKNASTPGSISFPVRIDYTAGTNPASIAAGDLNRDGKPDLVVRNTGSSTISIFKNTSTSGIIQFAAKRDYTIGSSSGGLSIGDLNGDGKPDVAVSSGISGIVSLYTNTSGVDSIKLSAPANFATGYGPTGIAIGDVNGDGRYDFAVGNNYSQVTIFKNNQFVDTTCPVITNFFPTSGQKGTTVYILGSHFTGSTGVRFGGVPADSVVIMNDTMIRAKVDTGATGSVQVLSPYCT
ncbi:MAG TPA: FG-GAP-like repeat-containing protein, partial [Niastella sp.]